MTLIRCPVVLGVSFCMSEMATFLPISSPFIRFAGRFVDDAFGVAAGYNFFFFQASLAESHQPQEIPLPKMSANFQHFSPVRNHRLQPCHTILDRCYPSLGRLSDLSRLVRLTELHSCVLLWRSRVLALHWQSHSDHWSAHLYLYRNAWRQPTARQMRVPILEEPRCFCGVVHNRRLWSVHWIRVLLGSSRIHNCRPRIW